jgi:pilus assembly protein CpaC
MGMVPGGMPFLPGRGIIVPINATKTIPIRSGRKAKDIRVENPAFARVNVSPDARSILVTGLVAGTTRVLIVDEVGEEEILDILVQNDVEYLRYILKRTVPTANVEPIPSANNAFILCGTVAKSTDIPILLMAAGSVVGPGNVVPALRVGGVMQVQLDVVIAQVSRTMLRQMSFNYEGGGPEWNIAQAFPGGQNLNALARTGITPGVPNQLQSLAQILSPTSTLNFGIVGSSGAFFGFLNALRQEQLAKILAQPRVVTLSGRPASFLSGGRLAVPQPSGLGTNSVRFEDFGTQLNFLPIVLGNGKIYLEVEPVVSNIDAAFGTTISGTTVPGFVTQRMQTAIEMEDGQTLAIGGLIQQQVNATIQKIPLLGDVPFLNVLFTSKSYQQQETELLILVTPHLVDPSTCTQLPKLLPGQETRIPDDFELYLEGIIEAPRGQRAVFTNWHYNAAYKSSPSNAYYPCCARPSRDYVPGVPCSNGNCGCGANGPDGAGMGVPGGYGPPGGPEAGPMTLPAMPGPVGPPTAPPPVSPGATVPLSAPGASGGQIQTLSAVPGEQRGGLRAFGGLR